MKQKQKKLLSLLLSLVMALTLAGPGFSALEVMAEDSAYSSYVPTGSESSDEELEAKQVIFNDHHWYIIEDNSDDVNDGFVTLLLADTGERQTFGTNQVYGTSAVRAYLDGLTEDDGEFADVASAIRSIYLVDGEEAIEDTNDFDGDFEAKLYLLSKTEANLVPENVRKYVGDWWTRSYALGTTVARVSSTGGTGGGNSPNDSTDYRPYARFALQMDLSKVSFSTSNQEFNVLVETSDYILTIPAQLEVTQAGWNPTSGISVEVAEGYAFESWKDLSVRASSGNKAIGTEYQWKLVSGDATNGYQAIGYKLGELQDGATEPMEYDNWTGEYVWYFYAPAITSGTTRSLGIIVDDYSGKPAGTYSDTVTFEAHVEELI